MTKHRFVCNHSSWRLSPVIALLIVFSAFSQTHAHEYWLDAVDSQWQVGQVFAADIRNGENFIGTTYPFDNEALRVGGLISDTGRRPLRGRPGDYPAINFKLNEPGLHLLLLETTPREVSYDNAQAFNEFLDYHDLQETIAALSEQPVKEGRIRERYYRFVKTLFNVAPAGSTQSELTLLCAMARNGKVKALEAQGQLFELIAKVTSCDAAELEVTVLLNGKPLAGRQIELFHLAGTDTLPTRSTAVSDAQGSARFNIEATGDYLVNSVWVSEPEIADVDWQTYWASLTFSH